MTTQTKPEALRLNVMNQIEIRLARIALSDCIPPTDADSIPGERLGRLKDDQKRMWRLMNQLQEEASPFIQEYNRLSIFLQGALGSKGLPAEIIKAAERYDVREAVAQHTEVMGRVRPLLGMLKIVTRVFYHDLRTDYDAWDRGSLVIDSDWNVILVSKDAVLSAALDR